MNNIAVKRKRCILLLSTSHFIHLTPKRKFRLNLLPQTISIGPTYSLLRFLFFFYFSTYKWTKICNITYNMIPYARKIHYDFFNEYFSWRVVSLINFVLNVSNLWNNHEKFLMYFFSIGHHLLYPLTKFELEIHFVHGETKKRNIIRG